MDWKEWRCKSAIFQAQLELNDLQVGYRGADLRSIMGQRKNVEKPKALQEHQSDLITLKSYSHFYQLHSKIQIQAKSPC